jgi:hypothetical protein
VITRYAFSDVGRLDEHPEGGWVKYEDVKELAVSGRELAGSVLVHLAHKAKLVAVSEGRKLTIDKLEEIVRASAEAGCPISQTYVADLAEPAVRESEQREEVSRSGLDT